MEIITYTTYQAQSM